MHAQNLLYMECALATVGGYISHVMQGGRHSQYTTREERKELDCIFIDWWLVSISFSKYVPNGSVH